MPISCLLPSMPYRSGTNPICTKQTQFFSHPLFSKYDQQHMTFRLLRSVQKPHFNTACHLNLKPDCLDLKNTNPKDDHVGYFLQTASDFTKTWNKQLLAVTISAISVCYSFKALAASGGVMGGGSFSSRSSSSGSGRSSSRSSSGGSGSSSSRSSSGGSGSSSSRSSSGGSSLSSSSWSSSSSSPSSSSNLSTSSSPTYSESDYEYTTYLSSRSLSSSLSKSSSPTSSESEPEYTTSTSVPPKLASTKTQSKEILGFFIVIVSLVVFGIAILYTKVEKKPLYTTAKKALINTGVIKLQVALLGSARSFQRDINEIAMVADTSTIRGFKNILTESSLALSRHSAYWESSHLSVYKEQCIVDGEKRFSRLSFEERSKFDQETLVNLDNSRREEKLRQQFDDPSHDFIVVTFIVAVLGILELPSPKSRSDLIAILHKLISIPEKEILAVQVLWTPQDENDTLSSERVLKDYPYLQPL